jgi:CheY-like chemotaxis protein
MSGPEALKRVRQAGNNTPVIALTANNMKHEIEQYKRLGFSDHVAKPISRATFINVLSQFLNDEGEIDSPISNDDMLGLIEDYRIDLTNQWVKLDGALASSDLQTISQLAHRIRGSASAFGYQLLGNRFADIEHSAMQDDEIAVNYELPILLELAKLCTELPGVNVAAGIVNHQANVETLLRSIHGYLYQCDTIIQDLKLALASHQVNSALVNLYKLLPIAKSCGLEQSLSAYQDLEKLIKQGEWTADQYSYLMTAIEQHIRNLTHCITPNFLEQL